MRAGVGQVRPIIVPRPSITLRVQVGSSIAQPLSVSIGTERQTWRQGHGREARADHQSDHPPPRAAPNRATRRLDDLRDGAARGVPKTLCTISAVRRVGSGGGRSLAAGAAICARQPRTVTRCQATALAPSSRAGSGSNIGIEGGMRTAGRFFPATQASMMSDHSCIIWRR